VARHLEGQAIGAAVDVLPPRSEGEASLAAAARDGRTCLTRLRQRGSAKIFLPEGGAPNGALDAVLLNTSGGVTGGDRFVYGATAEQGAWLRCATQAAERAYRAQSGETGSISVNLCAGSGARLDWLPQETILFDQSSLQRRLTADLAPDATFLAVEPLVFGRAAMGERLASIQFSDQWRVRRGGELVYADALRLSGRVDEVLPRRALLAGAGAMASVLYVGDDAETHLKPVREALSATAGASLLRSEVLCVRVLAQSGFELRKTLIPILSALGRAPLPKVWTL